MRKTLLRPRKLASAVVLSLVVLVPSTGFAHHGDAAAAEFLAGLEHPWTGLDHIVAMFAVGFWAMLMRNESIPAKLGAVSVGSIALFWFAHGSAPAAGTTHELSQLGYSAGFLISMLALQLMGAAIAASLSPPQPDSQVSGSNLC